MVHLRAHDVSLQYRILESRPAAKARIGSELGAKIDFENRTVDALKHVSLDLGPGDRLALIGKNGGGKSTLLNILAGILEPTTGHVDAEGDISAIFNIGLGIRRDSTGLKNIQIRCLMAGLDKAQTRDVVDSVIEFAELGDYLHLPVRLYSSGMSMRLNFALSTAIHSDILLLDEWIGTGDTAFREKVAARMDGFVGQTNIVVLASHSLSILRRVCNKAIWLDRGEVRGSGDIETVANAYHEFVTGKTHYTEQKKAAEDPAKTAGGQEDSIGIATDGES